MGVWLLGGGVCIVEEDEGWDWVGGALWGCCEVRDGTEEGAEFESEWEE